MIRRWLLAFLFAAHAVTVGGCSSDALASVRMSANNAQILTRALSPTVNGALMTICGWFAVQASGAQVLFDLSTTTLTKDFDLEIDSGTAMELDVGQSTLKSMFTLTIGSWYFLAVTVSGSSPYTYTGCYSPANGGALTCTSGTSASGPNGAALAHLEFGGYLNTSSFPWNGNYQSVMLWSGTALTQAQLTNQQWSLRPIETTNLAGFWSMQQNSDQTIDYSGNGQTLTAGGTATTNATNPPIAWQ